ncbi:MAG: pantoate--beta-alanine ligase [Paracoccaceae bacterium]
MQIVRTVPALRERVADWRARGDRIGLVPTMGALHEGHLSLVALAREHAARTIATIFVNPTQFGPAEDLDAYPRDEARDARMLEAAGCDLLFAPSVEAMYPPGFATRVSVTGLADVLCGASRPGHFDGVAQVVAKYLNQARADLAVFGEKDWQQLVVIRRLARDLDIDTAILGAPVAREADGLAMSSRNRYLGPEERRVAGRLNALMREAIERLRAGAAVRETEAETVARLLEAGFGRVDYVELRQSDDLARAGDRSGPNERLFVAARLGRARLIDNMPV